MLERAGGEWPPDEREQYEGTLAAVEAGLHRTRSSELVRRGAAMSIEQGVAYALSEAAAG